MFTHIIHVSTYAYAHMYIRTYIHTYTHIQHNTVIYIHMYNSIYTCVCVRVGVFVLRVHMYACMYTCMDAQHMCINMSENIYPDL